MSFLDDHSGQAGLQVIVLLGALSLAMSGLTGFVAAAGLQNHRLALGFEDETRLWQAAGQCVKELEACWNGEQGPSWTEWAGFCRGWEARGCTVRELSSRINLFWISSELLSGPGFARCFAAPDGPEILVREREENGFSLDLDSRLGDLVKDRNSLDMFSPWSGFNLLTGDALALARAYAERTQDVMASEVFRYRLVEGRTNRRKLDVSSAQALLAPWAAELSDLFSLEPPVNLNLVDETELHCLVQSSLFALPEPEELYRRLLDARSRAFVTREEIGVLIQERGWNPAGKPSKLADWLGSSSSHFSLVLSGQVRNLELVFRLESRKSGGADLVPVFQSLRNHEKGLGNDA